MRKIKFRGLRKDGHGWAQGHYLKTPVTTEFSCDGQFLDAGGVGRHVIVQDGVAHEVDPSTIGEFTGLTDKNGKEIYEGDIVRDSEHMGVVHFKAPAFIVCDPDGEWLLGNNTLYPADKNNLSGTEVIGNVHENPELLK